MMVIQCNICLRVFGDNDHIRSYNVVIEDRIPTLNPPDDLRRENAEIHVCNKCWGLIARRIEAETRIKEMIENGDNE